MGHVSNETREEGGAIKTALEGCLQERGFQVAGWSKAIGKPVVVPSGAAIK